MGSAAADVPLKRGFDLASTGIRILFQQAYRTHNHSCGAVAALEGVLLEECFLNGMQLAVMLKRFDSGDLLAVGGFQSSEAGANGSAVHQNRTCSALAFAAAVLRSGEFQFIAKHVEERTVRITMNGAAYAVDYKVHALSI